MPDFFFLLVDPLHQTPPIMIIDIISTLHQPRTPGNSTQAGLRPTEEDPNRVLLLLRVVSISGQRDFERSDDATFASLTDLQPSGSLPTHVPNRTSHSPFFPNDNPNTVAIPRSLETPEAIFLFFFNCLSRVRYGNLATIQNTSQVGSCASREA